MQLPTPSIYDPSSMKIVLPTFMKLFPLTTQTFLPSPKPSTTSNQQHLHNSLKPHLPATNFSQSLDNTVTFPITPPNNSPSLAAELLSSAKIISRLKKFPYLNTSPLKTSQSLLPVSHVISPFSTSTGHLTHPTIPSLFQCSSMNLHLFFILLPPVQITSSLAISTSTATT